MFTLLSFWFYTFSYFMFLHNIFSKNLRVMMGEYYNFMSSTSTQYNSLILRCIAEQTRKEQKIMCV